MVGFSSSGLNTDGLDLANKLKKMLKDVDLLVTHQSRKKNLLSVSINGGSEIATTTPKTLSFSSTMALWLVMSCFDSFFTSQLGSRWWGSRLKCSSLMQEETTAIFSPFFVMEKICLMTLGLVMSLPPARAPLLRMRWLHFPIAWLVTWKQWETIEVLESNWASNNCNSCPCFNSWAEFA